MAATDGTGPRKIEGQDRPQSDPRPPVEDPPRKRVWDNWLVRQLRDNVFTAVIAVCAVGTIIGPRVVGWFSDEEEVRLTTIEGNIGTMTSDIDTVKQKAAAIEESMATMATSMVAIQTTLTGTGGLVQRVERLETFRMRAAPPPGAPADPDTPVPPNLPEQD